MVNESFRTTCGKRFSIGHSDTEVAEGVAKTMEHVYGIVNGKINTGDLSGCKKYYFKLSRDNCFDVVTIFYIRSISFRRE